jgi:hypothetical protein
MMKKDLITPLCCGRVNPPEGFNLPVGYGDIGHAFNRSWCD